MRRVPAPDPLRPTLAQRVEPVRQPVQAWTPSAVTRRFLAEPLLIDHPTSVASPPASCRRPVAPEELRHARPETHWGPTGQGQAPCLGRPAGAARPRRPARTRLAEPRLLRTADEPTREDERMVIVRATRKLLQRLGARPRIDIEQSTTLLGDWYATVLPWRPRQAGLFVSERTLLPVLMPLAPAATLLDRFPAHLSQVLARHDVDAATVAKECIDTTDYQVAATASRSVVGSMNEFAFLAERYRQDAPDVDLTDLSVRLSSVPCGPLYPRHISPDRRTPSSPQGLVDRCDAAAFGPLAAK